ncbi:MAG: ATP/cobalamin adenosyltransferase [Candidatus Nomurabacteria bacterium GW2011_GWA2_40_9]|uniref:Corrinoid adenosyltransferase n=1 Tax=Candidatus Nomurabacteria bacterium GW2011_GWA2_40_9 TaxID=1618734 RepID=A0A0G0TR73_9BACT|nr:MAG: ATP/cobalamin adenosyltransferase [Candidatus Nomurabacteria bacterium GW2011_GWA2_40_9]
MLYTRKGDNGTTKTFGCDQRISKSSAIAEALGSLDEINSFLGLVKIKSIGVIFHLEIGEIILADIINRIQQDLFIVQAELAGADKKIDEQKVEWLEGIIDGIEKKLPPIKTFFVSGGTELATLCDISRTIARRAERRVVGVSEEIELNKDETKKSINKNTLAYLNRLSSILYAFARMVNLNDGITEETPKYD